MMCADICRIRLLFAAIVGVLLGSLSACGSGSQGDNQDALAPYRDQVLS